MKKDDPKWLELFESFIQHLRISSKEVQSEGSRGAIFNLWGSQHLFLKHLAEGLTNDQRYFYCLKSRQVGISTVSLAIDIFWMAMYPGTQGVLVTDTDGNRKVFRQILKRYIQSFPKGFFGANFAIQKGSDNSDMMGFNNGSRLDLLVAGKRETNTTLGEGRGYSFAHLTEVANYGSQEGLDSFMETLAKDHPDRLFILESTAKGYNHWHTSYTEAKRDPLMKHAMFIGWWAVEKNSYSMKGPGNQPQLYHTYSYPIEPDEREKMKIVKEKYGFDISMEQLAWFRHRQANAGQSEESLAQNQPWYEEEAFVLSGYSFFQTRVLNKDLERIHSVEYEEGPPGQRFDGYKFYLSNNFFQSKMESVNTVAQAELRMWEPPDEKGTYVIGCDPAGGRNEQNDNSAISIWRCYADRLDQCAEFADNLKDTRQVAWVLAFLAGAYRNAVLNVELSGGYGYAVLSEFKSLRQQLLVTAPPEGQRENIWEDFTAQARWYLYRKYDTPSGGNSLLGFKTSRDTKIEIMNQLRDSHIKEELIIHSVPLVEELKVVVVGETGSIEAPGRNKDDRVFAAALANRAWIDQVRPGMIAMGATYAAVQAGADGTETGWEGFGNAIVDKFFKRKAAEEEAGPVSNAPQWMRDRNLV